LYISDRLESMRYARREVVEEQKNLHGWKGDLDAIGVTGRLRLSLRLESGFLLLQDTKKVVFYYCTLVVQITECDNVSFSYPACIYLR